MVKYIAIKSGHRYVNIKDDGTYTLVKSVKQAMLWPVDYKHYMEEGLQNIKESGLNVRLVLIDGTGE